MENEKTIKKMVQEKYGEIALQSEQKNRASCCGASQCSDEAYNIMTDSYNGIDGYDADADLGLGCGLPTHFAQIKKGHTVVDLGSGAGNDCFVARNETGADGKVIGIDFTPAMIEKAKLNAKKLGFTNIEFLQGDIENLPLPDNTADVVISNCVLNLVPNKQKAFSEMHRVLKEGAHFCISDIVLDKDLPSSVLKSAELYAGCVAGAIGKEEYLQIIKNCGFENIEVVKEKQIIIPQDILSKHLSQAELKELSNSQAGIYSITVKGIKAKACGCKSDCCE